MTRAGTAAAERTLVVWVPDWPVHAHAEERRETGDELDPRTPIALIAARRVVACSGDARAHGVRPGMREREALSHCPDLGLLPHDPAIDERRFAPVLAAIEEVAPGVDAVRPGLCALRGRGPARYYGGEEEAAEAVLAAVAQLGFADARIGIADGLFAAEQAVRAPSTAALVDAPAPRVRVVAAGAAAAFLGPLPVERACDEAFAALLRGLGIRTLGALAALPESAVRERFGAAGTVAHRRARALPAAPGAEVRPRPPVRELSAELAFEPPIGAAEQLAFAVARLAERFVAGLTAGRLVCTALRVELVDDIEVRHERIWEHPRHFTVADVVNRIRWQAEAEARGGERGGAGIAQVRISPARTEHAAAHEPALWSTEPDARVHHRFTQVQSRLGHTGIGTLALDGGRLSAERQRFVPWGMRRGGSASAGPWPGALPGPHPATVFAEPPPAEVLDADGSPVGIDSDDLLSATPRTVRIDGDGARAVEGWSAPWPVRERWWEGRPARFRLQVQLADGTAWLLRAEHGRWCAEGQYD
ncbi:DNA polymerase Y family protein [Leucobacter sp. GX0328]